MFPLLRIPVLGVRTLRNNFVRPLATRLRAFAGKYAESAKRYLDPDGTKFVTLYPDGPVQGHALVAHLVDGVMAGLETPLIRTHNHYGEARLIAECLLDRGYAVDFISYRNRWFTPKKRYDLFIGARTYFDRLADRLNSDCLKIVHLDTAHWLSNNHAALVRLQDVRRRRGVALTSYTPIEDNRGIETADYATLLGNELTYETYAFSQKSVFQIPNPATVIYPWDPDKDFDACRRRFLWLGSTGFVQKGLDLVLEAFARMPEMHLTVCGPIDRDPHFSRAYHRELYELPNIDTVGWIDVTGQEFSNLSRRTLAHVYPSSAEGCCGSVVNCMHAGLIPVATRTAGVDILPSFGQYIMGTNVEAVERAVRHIAGLPADTLAEMARMSWQQARDVFSPKNYKDVLGDVIDLLLNLNQGEVRPGFIPMATRPMHPRHSAT